MRTDGTRPARFEAIKSPETKKNSVVSSPAAVRLSTPLAPIAPATARSPLAGAFDVDPLGKLTVSDACPAYREIRNGIDDHDGCPDQIPTEFPRDLVFKGAPFRRGEVTLGAVAKRQLDHFAAAMAKYPDLNVTIVGRTDADGGVALNVEIASQRATAVRDYLLSKGVAPERLSTRAAHPFESTHDNVTPQSRARNRAATFEFHGNQTTEFAVVPQ